MFTILFILSLVFAVPAIAEESLLGFGEEASARQREQESQFDAHLSASDQLEWIRKFSMQPHHVGSAAGARVADELAALLEGWGYETEIEEYEILLPTPRTRELELVAPHRFKASLTEQPLDEDPSTSSTEGLLPPYNAFSIDGEAEGELVFINYGRPEDHELLERYGISLEGKVAIAKYGRSWRGIKPKLAAEKGAIATLIYSDPADDGYVQGDTYPDGPFKHASGVQRGSVMDMPTYTGDVLTPGRPATKRARRLDLDEVTVLTKIPVLPISYADAAPLLAAMGGERVPKEWVGGLPITYHLGPGPARVRLKLAFDWNRVPARDVIARMKGSEYPDEWVIRGNHHDGWNHGAADPLSGVAALLDEARSVSILAGMGMKPARTIVYALWDAEEPGLIGSTEWVEDHARELDRKAVAYLNTDGNSRGFLGMGGSHTLERFFSQVARDVVDPQTQVSVAERMRAYIKVNGSEEARGELATRKDLRLAPLGSGSDYTPFLQHLGIASANLGFGGEGPGGSYHTLYDTFEHYTTWRDPGLSYGVALSSVVGRATMRLANARRLPFRFENLVDNLERYVAELEKLADEMRKETERTNSLLDEKVYALALDPTKSFGPPPRQEPVPHFNFAPLRNALDALGRAAKSVDALDTSGWDGRRIERLNRLLYTAERRLTRDEGLAQREWYKHHVYAPGFYTGYGVKTIPGVREAIEVRDFDAVEGQVAIAAGVLDSLTAQLQEILQLAES